MKLQDFVLEYGAMAQLDKMWSKPVGSQQHLLKKSKKKKKNEQIAEQQEIPTLDELKNDTMQRSINNVRTSYSEIAQEPWFEEVYNRALGVLKTSNNKFEFRSLLHVLIKSKKKKKTETKEAPKGTYFTKSGNLVKGKLTKAAKERGARETDPKDKSRSKVPPVTQTRESDFDYDSGKPTISKEEQWARFLSYRFMKNNQTRSVSDMESIIKRQSPKDFIALMRLKDKFFAGDQDLKTENAIMKGVEEGTRCWKGYKKKGMKTMFGKRVPNCVKNEDKDNVTHVNFGRDQSIEKLINPGEPQKAYDAFAGDYLPFYFSNGMELNLMDEEYSNGEHTVWVLNDANGKEMQRGEKADALVSTLQDMTQTPIQQDVANVDDVDENFADGKKKGKSKPGRVKRSGASCKGSVTSLRKKAKNSSGEKSKMYHWCANMKSGKKKK